VIWFETVGFNESSRDIPVPAGGLLTGFEGVDWEKVAVALPLPLNGLEGR